MTFEATEEYKEVSLAEGLNLLQLNKVSKLYSDGLEENEYIEFDSPFNQVAEPLLHGKGRMWRKPPRNIPGRE